MRSPEQTIPTGRAALDRTRPSPVAPARRPARTVAAREGIRILALKPDISRVLRHTDVG
ncbi:MAG: hypothetical protein KJN73_09175 [Acidimicrobiia bacterium]|nr:hypothetical protein [Acidimicrobiia bacterium]